MADHKKASDHKAVGNGVSLDVKSLEIMLRSFLFLLIMNIFLLIKNWIYNQSFKSDALFKQILLIICTGWKSYKQILLVKVIINAH